MKAEILLSTAVRNRRPYMEIQIGPIFGRMP